MIRHFLGTFFFAFIGLVLFVQLFQFSGASLPFEMPFGEVDMSNRYFGFSSIFNFVSAIGQADDIKNALTIIDTAFGVIKDFSINDVVELFVVLRSSDLPQGLEIVFIITQILKILFTGLIQPFVYLIFIAVLILGLFMFLWALISIFCKFLVGYYNNVVPASTLLGMVNTSFTILQSRFIGSCC